MNNNTLPLLLLFLLSGNDSGGCDNRTMLAMCLSLLLLFDSPDSCPFGNT